MLKVIKNQVSSNSAIEKENLISNLKSFYTGLPGK